MGVRSRRKRGEVDKKTHRMEVSIVPKHMQKNQRKGPGLHCLHIHLISQHSRNSK